MRSAEDSDRKNGGHPSNAYLGEAELMNGSYPGRGGQGVGGEGGLEERDDTKEKATTGGETFLKERAFQKPQYSCTSSWRGPPTITKRSSNIEKSRTEVHCVF